MEMTAWFTLKPNDEQKIYEFHFKSSIAEPY